jgi:hypothetical protein
VLHAEDVLRYKAEGLAVNKRAVIELFKSVKSHLGVEEVAISHFALSSVVPHQTLSKKYQTFSTWAAKEGGSLVRQA